MVLYLIFVNVQDNVNTALAYKATHTFIEIADWVKNIMETTLMRIFLYTKMKNSLCKN